MNKKILIMLNTMLILIPTITFAENDSYGTITQVSNAILNALTWVAYAIALGVLIFFGIKYILSGASEKANLKNKIYVYLLGVGLIVLCVTIARTVANIASSQGGDTPESFVDKTIELSGLILSDDPAVEQPTDVDVTEENGNVLSREYTYEDGTRMVETYAPNGQTIVSQTYYEGDENSTENRTRTVQYDANGNVISDKKFLEDGTFEETKYVENLTTKGDYVLDIISTNAKIVNKNGEEVESIDFNAISESYNITYYDTGNNAVAEGKVMYMPDTMEWGIEKNTFGERKQKIFRERIHNSKI